LVLYMDFGPVWAHFLASLEQNSELTRNYSQNLGKTMELIKSLVQSMRFSAAQAQPRKYLLLFHAFL